MNDQIVWQFVRLQKTGGSSLLRHLRDIFPQDVICDHHFEYQLSDDPRRHDYKLYHGHISAKGLDQYVTAHHRIYLLRDPIERLISCYYYWFENALTHPTSEFFTKLSKMSFLDFVSDTNPLFRNAIYNAQARLLAGGTFGADNHSRTNIIGPDLSSEDIIKAARHTIDSAYFVGITEMLDQSVKRLFTKMQRTPPENTLHINRGKLRSRTEKPDASILDIIMQNTVLDREIYAYAMARFTTPE